MVYVTALNRKVNVKFIGKGDRSILAGAKGLVGRLHTGIRVSL